MHLHGFHHLALQVMDLERTCAFYRDILGFPEKVRHHRPDGTLRSIWLALPDRGFLALEACSGGPRNEEVRKSEPGLHLVAFQIAREERAHIRAELVSRGVAVTHESRWSMYVQDPEGNRVAFSHYPEDPLP